MDISYYKKYEPIFGEWHIVREIGEGSFGKVFEIEREDFGHTYKAALKAITIPQSQSEIKSAMAEGLDEDSVSSYFRGIVQDMVDEFVLMSKLKGHSNIVSYEDHSVIPHQDGLGWDILIRMELLTPLPDYVKTTLMDEATVVKLGTDMCRALEQCKKHNIIHRDIKPENMFISELGDFKLGDFGVARTAERTMGGMSKKGTYVYMAPEVYKGEEYGASADMYSLGVVLYRLCNHNRVPFLPAYPAPISYRDREEALSKSMKGEPIPAPANASEELAQIILKACAYKSKDRYVSPTEMREALESVAKSSAATIAEQPVVEDNDKTVGIFGAAKPPVVTENLSEVVTVPEVPIVKMETPAAEAVTVAEAPEDEKTVGVFTPAAKPEPEKKPVPEKETEIREEKPAAKKKKGSWKKWGIAILAVVVIVVIAFIPNKWSDIVQVSAGNGYTFGVRANGTVMVAGEDYTGMYGISDWTDIIEINTRWFTTVGLKSDGTVVVTGEDFEGKSDISDWKDIIAVSAGLGYAVGLKSDGTVVATGQNGCYQCDVSDWTDIIAVSAGDEYTIGLRSDGTVVATGYYFCKDCDVSSWADIIAISAGDGHAVGLTSNGTVLAVGNNDCGQCDVSAWTDIIAVSAGDGYTIGLKSDGTVEATGYNDFIHFDPSLTSDWTDITSISAGRFHAVGVRTDGTVITAGDNLYGECDTFTRFIDKILH